MTDLDDDFEDANEAPGRYVYPGLPSTVLEVRRALISYEASRPRTLQRHLGPSEIGVPCAQQIARKVARKPDVDDGKPKWAPIQGTWVHSGMDSLIDHMNAQPGEAGRWERNTRVTVDPGLNLTGELDAYDTRHGMVVDWKHVGESTIAKLLKERDRGTPSWGQVSQQYRVQTHLYARGQQLAGRPVRFVRVVFLFRGADFDRSEEWTEPYNEALAIEAIERYRQIFDHVDRGGSVLDVRATYGDCYFCPFRRWGVETDEHGCSGKA